jgi:hypothetical protein
MYVCTQFYFESPGCKGRRVVGVSARCLVWCATARHPTKADHARGNMQLLDFVFRTRCEQNRLRIAGNLPHLDHSLRVIREHVNRGRWLVYGEPVVLELPADIRIRQLVKLSLPVLLCEASALDGNQPNLHLAHETHHIGKPFFLPALSAVWLRVCTHTRAYIVGIAVVCLHAL